MPGVPQRSRTDVSDALCCHVTCIPLSDLDSLGGIYPPCLCCRCFTGSQSWIRRTVYLFCEPWNR